MYDRPGSPGECYFPLLYYTCASAYHECREEATPPFASSARRPALAAPGTPRDRRPSSPNPCWSRQGAALPLPQLLRGPGLQRCKDELVVAVNESPRVADHAPLPQQHHRLVQLHEAQGDVEVLPRYKADVCLATGRAESGRVRRRPARRRRRQPPTPSARGAARGAGAAARAAATAWGAVLLTSRWARRRVGGRIPEGVG